MARTRGSSGPKTQQAIREAGLRLIYEHGYEAMSLRDLAREVGIQAGSLYNHIATKQQLLVTLVEDHLQKLLVNLDAVLKGVEKPEDRLRAFIAFHVNYHMARKREVSVVNSELRSLDPTNYEHIVGLRRAYEQRLDDILGEGMSAGVFAKADTRVTTFAILALLTGVCTWYRPNGRLGREAIVALHTRLVLDGLAKRARPKPARSSKPARGRVRRK